MNIVVTGGGGFLGRAVGEQVKRLIPGAEYVLTDRHDGPDVVGMDVTSKREVDMVLNVDVDAVIHLAGVLGTAELFDAPHLAVDVNVHGALNVIERCAKIDAAYIGITMPPVFPSVYTATKVCADRLASAYAHSQGLRVAHVVAYNAYGPGQKYGHGHPQKIIPTFATLAWEGKPIPIWGDGNQTVDLVHSDDVARCLVEAASILEHITPLYANVDGAVGYNDITIDAGTGFPLTVNEVADFVLEVTGSQAGVEHLPMRAGEEPTHIVAAGQGWTRMTGGWRPTFSWDRLAQVIEAYRPNARP